MSTYLTRPERAALAKLPVAERQRVLSKRFARECPNAEHSDHPGLIYHPGVVPAGFWCNPERAFAFDRLGAAELDQIEAQIEREQTPLARIVQLLAPAVPLHVQVFHADPFGRPPERAPRAPVPVVALALREDGTVSALTELDVVAGGAVAERFPRSKIEIGASERQLASRPSVAKLALSKKAQVAK